MQGYLSTDIIKMNVGGNKEIAASRKILCSMKDSALEKMFNGVHPLKYIDDGKVFIDRDSHYFGMLINYLRNNRRYWPAF